MDRKRLKKLMSILTTMAIIAMNFTGAFSVAAEESDVISENDVTEAILYNHADGADTPENVVGGNDYDVTASLNEEGKIEVAITATDVKLHENANHNAGYWVGFAVKAPDDATYASGTFGNDAYTEESVVVINENGDTGVAFYVNAGALAPKTEATLQWFNSEGTVSEVEAFVIDIDNVTLDIADYTPVVVKANIADYDEEREVYTTYELDTVTTPGVVTISMTGLKEHTSKIGEGYWTGFAVEAPDGATQFKYAFNTSADAAWEAGLTPVEDINGEGKLGAAFITNVNTEIPKRFVKLQWFDANGNVLTEEVAYEMNIDGVKYNWISEETVTLAPSTGTAEVGFDTEQNDGIITVKYTEEALDKHANGIGAQGYWVGFAVEAPNPEAKAKVTFGEYSNANMTLEDIDTEKKGVAFYTNAGAAEPKTEASLQWVDAEGNPISAPTTFVVDLTDVTLALDIVDYTPVVVKANIADYDEVKEVYTTYELDTVTTPGVVAISMTGLKEHTSEIGEGYWTGFAVEAPDGATQFKYAFGTSADAAWEAGLTPVEDINGEGKLGAAFITDTSVAELKRFVKLQWFDADGNALTDAVAFEMNFDGVKYNWIKAEDVSAAVLNDTAGAVETLCTANEVETQQNDGRITVKVLTKELALHQNDDSPKASGYWTGFAVDVPAEATHIKYTFDKESDVEWVSATTIPVTGNVVDGKISLYTNAGAAEPKLYATLQWLKDGEPLSAPTKFVVDISGVTLASLPYIIAGDVKVAKIVNQDNTSVNPYNSYSISTVSNENGVIVVNINMTDLKSHKNGENVEGYWTGFAVTAPDDAATMRYAFASDRASLTMVNASVEAGVAEVDGVEKNGVAFYTNAGNAPKKYVRLQWFNASGEAITNATDFEMNLTRVKLYSEPTPVNPPRGGGSSNKNYYTVKFESNGGSTVAAVKVNKEATVAEPAVPFKDGFVFDGWYTDKEFTHKYDFSTVVTKSFTLYAKWIEKETATSLKFTDVKKDSWYYDVVKTIVEKGLMNGISETEFAPELDITRGMFVTILYRAAGEPDVAATAAFADVSADMYYAKAIAWASANGIVNGMTESEFAPDANITREQMAVILYRYAKEKKAETEITYADKDAISNYAAEAVAWAKAAGIMEGNEDGTFAPMRNSSRAEAAAVFVRILG